MRILVKVASTRYLILEVQEQEHGVAAHAVIVDSFNDDRGYRPAQLLRENAYERSQDASVAATWDRLAGCIPTVSLRRV